MQKNSNQQTYSVSIRGKREQLRTQIRREQLQQYFKAKRVEYFSEKKPRSRLDYYKQITERIEKCPYQRQALKQIQKEVRDLFEKYPQQSWNFIILGNLLLKMPSQVLDFERFLLRGENFSLHSHQEFAWCLAIYVHIICYQFWDKIQELKLIPDIIRLDIFFGIIIDNYFQNFQVSEHSCHCLDFYMECFKLILHLTQKQNFFPVNSFNSIISNLSQYYKTITQQKKFNSRNIKINITDLIIDSIAQIKQKELYAYQTINQTSKEIRDYIINPKSMENLMKCAAEVFLQNIQDSSQNKTSCLKSISILSHIDPINAADYLFTQKIVEQFQFLMLNHTPQTRLILLKSFTAVLPSMNNTKTGNLLEHSFHVNLVLLFIDCLNEVNHTSNNNGLKYSESLYWTMKLIELLLLKVRQRDDFIFNRVFKKMQSCEFGSTLEKMGDYRYDQKIQEIEANLIDNYFSQEMEEQNPVNNENCGDYGNIHYNQNGGKSVNYCHSSNNSKGLCWKEEYQI